MDLFFFNCRAVASNSAFLIICLLGFAYLTEFYKYIYIFSFFFLQICKGDESLLSPVGTVGRASLSLLPSNFTVPDGLICDPERL